MSNPPPSIVDQMKAFMADSENHEVLSVEATMALRWNDGILEQKHLLTRWRNSKPIDQTHEWRAVPQAEV